jgi:SAM-dependent methyltransferase
MSLPEPVGSPYPDEAAMRRAVAAGTHRDVIGGRWDELGDLQLAFLKQRGLTRDMRVLDVGCGALRAGVKLAAYLEPARYYGIDLSPALLEAGYREEIEPAGLAARLPRANLAAIGDFNAHGFGVSFDMAIAQSVFSHLPAPWLATALAALASVIRPGGWVFATVFWAGENEAAARRRTEAITTYPDRDPFHYPLALRRALRETPQWRFEDIGAWGHPVGQEMLGFQRL